MRRSGPGKASRPTLHEGPASVRNCRRCKLNLVSPAKPKGKPSDHLRSALPLLKELVRPRRGLLTLGFLLMVINRVCGMVLPISTKFLIDNVIGKRNVDLLNPLIM